MALSESMRDHLQNRGVLGSAFNRIYQVDNALYTTEMLGNNAKTPYLPWGANDHGMTPKDKRRMAADYVLAKTDYMVNLDQRTHRPSIHPSVRGIHPALIHPTELARMGAAVNPTPQMQNPILTSRNVPSMGYNPHPAATDHAFVVRQNGFVGKRPNTLY